MNDRSATSYIAPRAELFDGGSSFAKITALQRVSSTAASNSTLALHGMITLPQPLNMSKAISLKDLSSHHSSCIQAKKNSTVGLGFLSADDIVATTAQAAGDVDAAFVASLLTGAPYIESNADKALDPLTLSGFNQVLLDAVEDYHDVGNGYIEVARDENGEIRYIGHIPAAYVHVCKKSNNIFYRVRTNETVATDRYYSRFGTANKEWLFAEGPYKGTTTIARKDVSELVVFTQPSNRCRYYGYPNWLAAAPDIDLLRKSKQYKADFYHNRGVMDFVLSVTGGEVDPDVWKDITSAVKGTAGEGNNWKNLAINIINEKAKVQVDRLAADNNSEDQFAKDCETFAQNIVSAHRVPPLLANILIPGKLGASNEYVSALISFQLLVVGPDQQVIQRVLARTLGNDTETGKNLKLKSEDFRLRTLTSQINLEGLGTLGKMREEAVATNRDLGEGVKD